MSAWPVSRAGGDACHQPYEMGDPEVGIVACGAAYQYVGKAFPGASF